MLAHREFILEGDRATTEVRDGIPFSDGSRYEIAKGYFGDLEKPIVTWVDGKGDLKNPDGVWKHSQFGCGVPGCDTCEATGDREPERAGATSFYCVPIVAKSQLAKL